MVLYHLFDIIALQDAVQLDCIQLRLIEYIDIT